LSRGRIIRIRERALAWYDREKRDLPWRKDRLPYRVWVSEVLLQQTRVETAIPYFERFLRRFPDVRALARAPVDDVLQVWSGIGYYRRARNLHRAAGVIVERFDGRVPSNRADLLSLPGIGEYTAGAILSIAFDRRAAAIDGNVTRVVSRIQAYRGSRAIREWVEALVPTKRPGDFNQSLMELGARICIPRNPRCGDCPVRGSCRARKEGVQGSIPRKVIVPTRPSREVAALIRRRERFLMRRRDDGDTLGGMWELPGGEARRSESLPGALRRIVGKQVRVGDRIAEIRHAIGDRIIRGYLYDCSIGRAPRGLRWVSRADAGRLPLTGATRKYLSSPGIDSGYQI
jgi:A/G-specific adenine glycosylase